jgi:outer membrane autotransporter protein
VPETKSAQIGLDGLLYEVSELGVLTVVAVTGADSYKPYFEGAAAAVLTVAEASRGLDTTVNTLSSDLKVDEFEIKLGFLGESIENETGSSVDLDQYGFSLAAGRKSATGAGEITYGAFLEGGSGDYETFNSLAIIGDVNGQGDTDYFGGGLFVRHDFTGGAWASLAVRFGSVKNDYEVKGYAHTHDIHYSADSDYYGINAGVGQNLSVSDSTSIDIYGQFAWTSVDGDTVEDGRGGEIAFDDTNSARVRVGARVNHYWTESFSGFFGLAWEHDFSGEVGGSYKSNGNVYYPEAPDFSGSSAYGELGLKFEANEHFAFQLSGFGLAGQSKGAGGLASLIFTF